MSLQSRCATLASGLEVELVQIRSTIGFGQAAYSLVSAFIVLLIPTDIGT